MLSNLLRTSLLCAGLLGAALSAQADTIQSAIDWAQQQPSAKPSQTKDAKAPLVIAHRGASGYVPEHTLAAYALAVLQGADYIEPDLVMTRDGQLVARHDNELGLTTDVAQHHEFADRKRTQTVDGVSLEGWFSEDFTLAELKTLRAIERIPQVRPANQRFDGQFEIPTLQEIIDLVKSLQLSQQRVIGLYPETKHPTHFQHLGLAIEAPLLAVLKRNGYDSAQAPVYIQSFEVENLKTLSRLTSIRLIQLLWTDGQPYDQQALGTDLSYAQMITPKGLQAIARYASGIGPEKSMIIPRDAAGNLTTPTHLVRDAHAAKLKVHPYTFRAENAFLPNNLRSGDVQSERGDIDAELRAFLATGIDGLFIDQPDIAVRLRETR
ncbi:Glycerophosphodiester phosphodiesterase [Pseudomonas sp. 8Z]|uniref:glycerophosphodiester phosphodiesterase n=1 Tax=Pseudomonas sp. 8Z TaxID=2653166 RepID=UPI0012EEE4B0|nr:glycerophosphodiester phosphodiesterase [Pseudomonas sp. 8Z]VXC96157.1 Glycerophosphodiester phosphodiesterase [Pseudomonas sp. 8Z]